MPEQADNLKQNRVHANQPEQIDLIALCKVLITKLWLIILVGVIGTFGGFFYAYHNIETYYEAQTLMFVNTSSVNVSSISFSSVDFNNTGNLISLYNVILKSRTTLNAIIEDAGYDISQDQLKSMISCGAVDSTPVMAIKVTSTDAEQAATIANSVAEVLPEQIESLIDNTSARIVEKAVVPVSGIKPDYIKYAVEGGIVGAGLVIAILTLLFMLDTSIHDEEYLLQHYKNAPILGIVPDHTAGGKKVYYTYSDDGKKKKRQAKGTKKKLENRLGDELSFEAAEAYRMIRTNLEFSMVNEDEGKAIVFTSALKGEGKTTTILNVAYALAQTGRKVLLLEADMRLPRIAVRLDIKSEKGLSDLLVKHVSLNDVVRTVPMGKKTASVITAGTIPPNPSELLASGRMKGLVHYLTKQYDYVLIDVPPVNMVTDSMVFSDVVDGTVLVVRYECCDKAALSQAMHHLENVKMKLLGFVLNDKSQSFSGYGYSHYGKYRKYGHDYGYGSAVDNEPWDETFDEKVDVEKNSES